jgi:hypothetical protein
LYRHQPPDSQFEALRLDVAAFGSRALIASASICASRSMMASVSSAGVSAERPTSMTAPPLRLASTSASDPPDGRTVQGLIMAAAAPELSTTFARYSR